jgi:hypothetical protein
MTKKRFEEIYANLSFMMPGSTQFPRDRLRKIRHVNDYLLSRAQAAWNIEQDAAIDESMIPTYMYQLFRALFRVLLDDFGRNGNEG